MPNYVRNVITFTEGFHQEAMERCIRIILRNSKEDPSSGLEEAANHAADLTLEERCRQNMVDFDFNALIPMSDSLNIESSFDTERGESLYQAYQNLPMILMRRISQAKIFEDIFFCRSADDVRLQYTYITEQLNRISSHNLVDNAVSKLNGMYLPVISSIEGRIWKTPTLPEMDYLPDKKKEADFSLTDLIKSELHIQYLYPAALLDFIKTERGKRLMTLGERRTMNLAAYGHADWYDWRIANWGTKWNASNTHVDWDGHAISFDTAWSAPEPIIYALSEAFPDVEFEWMYADEDCGYNTGIAIYKNGCLEINENDGGSPEAYNTYVECWGSSDCMYQDKDGNWNRYDCDNCPHPC